MCGWSARAVLAIRSLGECDCRCPQNLEMSQFRKHAQPMSRATWKTGKGIHGRQQTVACNPITVAGEGRAGGSPARRSVRIRTARAACR